ncbi:helix-turn-helix domain-containing protein [Leucobacter sp. wl10]|uniref:helix-turn-helix domain-containing protein n=1 Tax=Leucobacter sp. wl10 TaxID=2304677 RepID=UPI0013C2D207|nr:helix-turn-helix domain-containing protein [Leucobacter sp. wl10]
MTERRTRRRPGENRRRLLEAGLVEFGLFGYHGASTTGIAARAGVPQPHVYASFKTKQALFLACFARLSEVLAEDPEEDPSTPLVCFLYQCVAANGDPGMSDALKPGLLAVRESLGEARFDALLVEGARALIRR